MRAAAKTAAAKRGAVQVSAPLLASPPNDKPQRKPDMLKSGVKLEQLTGQDLRDYAKSAGVPNHIIESLTEDKLRRECLFRVQTFLDQLDD